MKTFRWLLVGAILAVSCFAVARAGPRLAETNAYFANRLQPVSADDGNSTVQETKFAANFKVTSAGSFSQILSYVPIDIKEPFGLKNASFQIWTYGGTSLSSAALNGGGSGVFRIKAGLNLYLNIGLDCMVEEGKRPVVSGVVGLEVFRF